LDSFILFVYEDAAVSAVLVSLFELKASSEKRNLASETRGEGGLLSFLIGGQHPVLFSSENISTCLFVELPGFYYWNCCNTL